MQILNRLFFRLMQGKLQLSFQGPHPSSSLYSACDVFLRKIRISRSYPWLKWGAPMAVVTHTDISHSMKRSALFGLKYAPPPFRPGSVSVGNGAVLNNTPLTTKANERGRGGVRLRFFGVTMMVVDSSLFFAVVMMVVDHTSFLRFSLPSPSHFLIRGHRLVTTSTTFLGRSRYE